MGPRDRDRLVFALVFTVAAFVAGGILGDIQLKRKQKQQREHSL